ncbi:hypothetical protein [Nesterenkonia alba]|uniref:hypothetical protein n=1 Tax=Nesterenkonia alba TaxID=515814 RepID=UPI0003B402B0|nr:hypothetical protein [Nesterenkonia alba]
MPAAEHTGIELNGKPVPAVGSLNLLSCAPEGDEPVETVPRRPSASARRRVASAG